MKNSSENVYIVFLFSLIIGFITSSSVSSRVVFHNWPWLLDFEELVGFIFGFVLSSICVLPSLLIQMDEIESLNHPFLIGTGLGLLIYPLAYGLTYFLSIFLKNFEIGEWFWPVGLIWVSILMVSTFCWFYIFYFDKNKL